jgi:hypothetical protein
MNTTNLVRHYEALTLWERLPLIVAAAACGDTVQPKSLDDHREGNRVRERLPAPPSVCWCR